MTSRSCTSWWRRSRKSSGGRRARRRGRRRTWCPTLPMSSRTAFHESLTPCCQSRYDQRRADAHPDDSYPPRPEGDHRLPRFDRNAGTVGLPYLDAVLPAEHRLAATRVVRDLGALPPDAILYLLAQPLLDLASDHLMRDRNLTARYEERFEVEDSDEWTVALAEYNREADAITAALFREQGEPGVAHLYLTDRRAFDRRME